MDVETITKLLDAGYTKAEIEKMSGTAADQQSEAGAAGNETAGEEQAGAGQENAGKIETGVSIEAAIEALTNTVAGLKDTVKAMQDANAGTAATGTATKDVIGETIKGFIDTL
jgi:hypothetical protein